MRADNPIWHVLALMRGAGYPGEALDLQAVFEAAQYCDEFMGKEKDEA